jgi:hypothetical protein
MAEPPVLPEAEFRALIARIERIAGRGRIVHLKPETARLCAHALRMTRPDRDRLVAYLCPVKRCDERRSCIPCIGKANAIIQLLRDV